MVMFKCKMCGGTLEFASGDTVAVCDSCGTKQTLPKLDDDRRANLYDRANHFRRNNEFDKAEGIYEQILNEDNTDAEAYWSLVLCRYGIEYVEDPITFRRVPTVNRAQFTSIFDDNNYKSALEHGDAAQREIYESEANVINEIQKGILAVSQKEEPFDVFICYKETDEHGRRTQDSVLANELYHELTREGFKVFFSRITLEDKLGTAYEPYIFAALNSAKVMVVIGTKPEYFNAVWVKNEWNRYLALIKNGAKKVLIPAYRNMDPYDLPEAFSHLQAQDMGKLGFVQDLIRGIKKLTADSMPKAIASEKVVAYTGNANVVPLLKRAFLFLEDENWQEANAYCEKVLDQDPECAQAYVGKLMVELKVRTQQELKDCAEPFDGIDHYRKAIRFADEKLKAELIGDIEAIKKRKENERLEKIYTKAVFIMNQANTESAYKNAADIFETISKYKDADDKRKECIEKGKKCIYTEAVSIMNEANTASAYRNAADIFKTISEYKDADEKRKECIEKAEIAYQEEIYMRAIDTMNAAKNANSYEEAASIFEKILEYKDSAKKKEECLERAESSRKDEIYEDAVDKMSLDIISYYEKAILKFETISGWRDADEQIYICKKRMEELDAHFKEIAQKNTRWNKPIANWTAIILLIFFMVLYLCAFLYIRFYIF